MPRRRVTTPSLAQSLSMLSGVYATLGWLAVQRLRHGSRWPWTAPGDRPGSVLVMRRPPSEHEDEPEIAARGRR